MRKCRFSISGIIILFAPSSLVWSLRTKSNRPNLTKIYNMQTLMLLTQNDECAACITNYKSSQMTFAAQNNIVILSNKVHDNIMEVSKRTRLHDINGLPKLLHWQVDNWKKKLLRYGWKLHTTLWQPEVILRFWMQLPNIAHKTILKWFHSSIFECKFSALDFISSDCSYSFHE